MSEIAKKKTENALRPYDGGWNNPLDEAIERIADHAIHFDARDLMAFRYVVYLAKQVKELEAKIDDLEMDYAKAVRGEYS